MHLSKSSYEEEGSLRAYRSNALSLVSLVMDTSSWPDLHTLKSVVVSSSILSDSILV